MKIISNMSEIETKQYNTYKKKIQKNWGDIFDIPLSLIYRILYFWQYFNLCNREKLRCYRRWPCLCSYMYMYALENFKTFFFKNKEKNKRQVRIEHHVLVDFDWHLTFHQVSPYILNIFSSLSVIILFTSRSC